MGCSFSQKAKYLLSLISLTLLGSLVLDNGVMSQSDESPTGLSRFTLSSDWNQTINDPFQWWLLPLFLRNAECNRTFQRRDGFLTWRCSFLLSFSLGLDLQRPHLALSPHWGCGRSLCYVGKLNKNQTKPSMLSVGSMSQLIIPQKMPVLVRNAWFHFPAEMKEGTGTPLPLETEAPGNLALAGCTFAYLSGHLIINLKKLLTDSLNTPDIQLELPSLLAPSLSPFIWALSSFITYLYSTSPFADLGQYLSFTSP